MSLKDDFHTDDSKFHKAVQDALLEDDFSDTIAEAALKARVKQQAEQIKELRYLLAGFVQCGGKKLTVYNFNEDRIEAILTATDHYKQFRLF